MGKLLIIPAKEHVPLAIMPSFGQDYAELTVLKGGIGLLIIQQLFVLETVQSYLICLLIT